MSSNLATRLKETVLSKNNATRIYKSLNNGVPLNISKEEKGRLGSKIVSEISNIYSTVDFSKVNIRNFDQIITGINKKVVNNINKYISREPTRPNIAQIQHKRPVNYMERYEDELEDDSDSESIGAKVKRMEAERFASLQNHRKPPKKINFSLDPDDQKEKKRERKRAEQEFQQFQQQRGTTQPEQYKRPVKRQQKQSGDLDDFYAPITDESQMTGEHELDKIYDTRITEKYIENQDPEYDAMLDPYDNNINSFTIDIDPDDEEYNERIPLDEKIKSYVQARKQPENHVERREQRRRPVEREDFQPTHDDQQYHQQRQMQRRQPLPRQVQQQRQRPILPQQRRRPPMQQQRQIYHQEPQYNEYYYDESHMHQDPYAKQVRFQNTEEHFEQPKFSEEDIQKMIDDAVNHYTLKYQDEITNLRTKLSSKPDNESSQIKLLNDELKKANVTIVGLTEKVKSASQATITEEKIQEISEKRQEIMQQMSNLKIKLAETTDAIEEEKKLKISLDLRKKDIIDMIEKNISLFNNNDKNEIINTSKCSKNAHIFIHKFKNPIDILVSLDINDYSFPTALHNITPYNNVLYIILEEGYSPSIMCDETFTYSKSKGIHKITIIPGNYKQDRLIETLSKILKQFTLKIKLKHSSDYVEIYSETHSFTLLTDYDNYPCNMLSILGFEHNASCANDKNFISTKSCDIRSDKIISLYILNINRTTEICKLNMTSKKATSFCYQIEPPIQNVEELHLEFRDSKNNPVFFAGKNVMLDFRIRSIEREVAVIIPEVES